jgi:hypothetical protein
MGNRTENPVGPIGANLSVRAGERDGRRLDAADQLVEQPLFMTAIGGGHLVDDEFVLREAVART